MRVSSRDSFCRVTSITFGFTPHAVDTRAMIVAASRPVPPVTAVQYPSAGWSGMNTRTARKQLPPVHAAPCSWMNARICGSVIAVES